MGKFDGILICSDWDGTLSSGGKVNEDDIRAINYFKDHGGLFTICTGRVYNYIREYFNTVVPNTHVITLNGAVITHQNGDCNIYEGFLTESVTKIIDTILCSSCLTDFLAYYKDKAESTVISVDDYFSNKASLFIGKIHKLVFPFKEESDAVYSMKQAQMLGDKDYEVSRSWPTGLEILSSKSTKGESVKRLKEISGAHTLITVGDFENDISMIKAADIGIAVENAVDALKLEADKITVKQSECAIAKIISEIEASI